MEKIVSSLPLRICPEWQVVLGGFLFRDIGEVLMDEYIPKSRKVPLGTGRIPSEFNQFDFMELVYGCRLSKGEKHVLSYLAFRYNFEKRRATKMGTRRAANDLDMERTTFTKYRDILREKGWLTIRQGNLGNPDRITLLIGTEDENLKWKDPKAKQTQYLKEFGGGNEEDSE